MSMYRPVSNAFGWINYLSWFFDKIVIDVRILDCANRIGADAIILRRPRVLRTRKDPGKFPASRLDQRLLTLAGRETQGRIWSPWTFCGRCA